MSTTSIPAARMADRVEAARRAQAEWERVPIARRLQRVKALRRLLASRWDELGAVLTREIGKSLEEALAGDILPLADACRFLEKQAALLLKPRRVPVSLRPLWMWGQRDLVHRRPRGVVAIIGTWNYPLFLNGTQIVQALVAGNSVVWKPSEVSPASAQLLHDLLLQAGFPPDLIQRLDASREAGAALVEADINHLVFTGSAAIGRRIAAHLGERLVSSTLELSGCDALFLLDDGDAELAARAAWFGAVLNRGQTCLAVRRAFIPASRYDEFCAQITRLSAAATPLALALPAQVQQAERLVQAALAEGGRLLSPARPVPANGKPNAFQPAVVADARPEMALCREASFAPLLAVLPYDSLDQAVAMAAQCCYGLGASIFTRSLPRAHGLAGRLRSGSVSVNDVIAPTAHPATPFGGHGDSGWGVTQGPEGLLEMTVPQVVSLRSDAFRPHYALPNAGAAGQLGELLRGLLESGHGATLGQRWRGWRRLLGALWRLR